MTIGKMFLLIALISFSIVGGFIIGQQNNAPVIAQKQPIQSSKPFDLLSKIKEEKIKEMKVWEKDEKEFYGVIREIDESPNKDSNFESSQKLSIYDETGKAVYETKDLEIENIQSVRLMKSDSWQIIVETNGGGTDNFLKILDYNNGKFTEIINESETQLHGGYFTMLQYRTGNKTAYFNPSQLVIIQQIGGAEENPSASVFRSKNNKFQNVGSFSMRDLGDLIEKQISQKK